MKRDLLSNAWRWQIRWDDSDGGKLNVTFCQMLIDGTPDWDSDGGK
jgi:hypothetical protein